VGHHHGDLHKALLTAALELVAERGPHGFTLAEASRRAGVSKGAPYRHFADRDALLAELVLRCYRLQFERFGAAMEAAGPDPTEQLVAFAGASVQFAKDERALFKLTFAGALDKTLDPALEEAGARVLTLLDAPARRLRPTAHGARRLLLAIAAGAHGFAVFHDEGVIPDPMEARAEAERVARLISGG
jgi:AcrR family transcriptional regulator